MSITTAVLAHAPDEVFAALINPRTYPQWLVGAKEIRSVDSSWPAPGSSFHHVVGVGPVRVPDHTDVLAVDEPRLLELNVRARPFGRAVARFTLVDLAGGRTEVTVDERPDSPILGRLQPVVDPGLDARNRRSLERLCHFLDHG
jgi:uncharacterized protein YndB with AHSA1/START domain